jgi:hypothetical protein
MKFRGLVLALAIVMPSTALAGPITVGGLWATPLTSVTDPAQGGSEVAPFWSGLSWDCATCGVGFLVDVYGTEGLEYLHDGTNRATGFRFDIADDISAPSLLYSITAWTNGVFGRRSDGAFTYDNGVGQVWNSWDNGEQFALFRVVGLETTQYFLGVEDISVSQLLNDHDHNDFVVGFTETHSVPEPSSLLLIGCALAAAGARKVRATRKARVTA